MLCVAKSMKVACSAQSLAAHERVRDWVEPDQSPGPRDAA
jgi:hypothetical protein